jgi:hypothetical protein
MSLLKALQKQNHFKIYIKHRRYYPEILSPLTEQELEEYSLKLMDCEPRGGLTEVSVYKYVNVSEDFPLKTFKEELIGTGIAQCSLKDNYCKKTGVELALRRALNKDEKTIS